MADSTLIKRLKYRGSHRGCKETDLILGHFGDTKLEALSPALLGVYEAFIEENDADIWAWLTGKQPPSEYEELIMMMKNLCLVPRA